MLKKSVTILTAVILGLGALPPDAWSAPSTKGRIGIGGQMGIGGMPAAVSLRFGLSDNLRLNALAGFKLAPNSIALNLGFQAEIPLGTANKGLQPFLGAGVYVGGLGSNPISLDLAALLGFEYFLTNDFTFEAAIGLPVSLTFATGAGANFGGISTYVNPIFGFHYYF
jgi:hypothetical protein